MTIIEDIRKTVVYGKKFGGKLSLEELKERLISSQRYNAEKIKNEAKQFKLEENKNIFREKKLDRAKKLANRIEKKFGDIC